MDCVIIQKDRKASEELRRRLGIGIVSVLERVHPGKTEMVLRMR